jgi:hypothetical protein
MNNFDLLNRQCDDVVLIAENYCLDKSFDILIRNFQFFEQRLNAIDDQNDRINVIKDRFNKNKNKYYKLLTFVNQFSASLENVNNVFNSYRNTWQTKDTPLEIVYEDIVPVTRWASFDQKSGKLTRFSSITNANVRSIARDVTEWANRNFVEEQYGIYNRIKVRLYIKGTVNDTFTFNGNYKEKCDANGHASGKATGVLKVCCNGCGDLGGYAGCNRMGPDGRTCGNMYRYCPPTKNSNNCATGTCKGWGEGTNPANWTFKELKITGRIVFADTYLLGYDTLTLELRNNRWVVIDL